MMDLSFWVSKNADFMPGKTAIRFEGQDITYSEFDRQIHLYARTLKHSFDVAPGDRVAFLGVNTPSLLCTFFACARLGAIFSPLNWRLTAPEHRYMLQDSGAKILISDEEFRANADAIRSDIPDCILVANDFEDADWRSLAAELAVSEGDDTNPNVTMDIPFMLVYTSGTTGRPKGAVLSQNNMQIHAYNSVHYSQMSMQDHILTVLPMFHVGGLNIQTTPVFYAGATVTMHRRFEPLATLKAIVEERPDLAVLVPAALQAIFSLPEWPEADISSLRSVAIGSSMVPLPHIEALQSRGVPAPQVYGSTETGPIVIYQNPESAFAKPGSAGKAGLHSEMRIVDDQGNDLPQGQSGEIAVRGGNIFIEYWNNKEATRDSIKDGWFLTGDVGYLDEDGDLWVNDRKKDLIISGGENIYPAEIEAFIHEMADVVDGVVVGKPDDKWGEIPLAVVILKEGVTLPEVEFIKRFQDNLARYKHPKEVLFVDDLPCNAMGKVQKFEVRKMIEG